MRIKVSQGKRGRWRWAVYDTDKRYRAGGSPVGWATREAALADALRVFSAAVDAEDEGGFPVYAGPREFDSL